MNLGHEDYPHVLDVLGWVEGCCRLCTFRADANLKRSQTVKFHALRVLNLCGHHLYQLRQHSLHVALLHGAVALNDSCDIIKVCRTVVHGTCIKLSETGIFLVVVLVNLVDYCHNCYPFF